MNELTQALNNLNSVLQGSQKIGVEAKMSNEDLLKLSGAMFAAFFLAVLLANAITK